MRIRRAVYCASVCVLSFAEKISGPLVLGVIMASIFSLVMPDWWAYVWLSFAIPTLAIIPVVALSILVALLTKE